MHQNDKTIWVRKSFDPMIALKNALAAKHTSQNSHSQLPRGLKYYLRKLLAPIYQLFKRIIRPFAFRLRHYMLAPFLERIDLLETTFVRKIPSEALAKKTTRPIILIGAGGHAKVVIELLSASGYQVHCCVGHASDPSHCLTVPVMKEENALSLLYHQGFKLAFVAVGDNSTRARIGKELMQQGFSLVNAISPSAIVSPSASIGIGVAIMSGAIINANASIDNFAIINTGATIDHDCIIGEAAHIAPQCALAGNVVIGEQSFLGVGSKVIPKMQIGNNVMLGAGSVVVSHIPASVTAFGVPATIKNTTTEVADG